MLALGAAGCAMTLLTMSLAWGRIETSGPTSTNPALVLTGREAAPGAFALALAALAGLGVLLLVGVTGRRLIGALLLVLGAGITVVCARAAMDLDALTRAGFRDAATLPLLDSPATASTVPLWAWVAALGGALIAGAGVLAVRGGPGWPAPSSRYSGGGVARPADPWRALDQGVDPTLDD